MDRWRNNISGVGKLIKKGTGTLKLMGNNTYSGGTQIDQGTLEGNTETAFGSGGITNNGGTLLKNAAGKLIIGGNYRQSAEGTLELNLRSKIDVLKKGTAILNGKLRLNFSNKYVPANGATILTYAKRNGWSIFFH